MKLKNLVIPNNLQADVNSLTNSYGKFFAEPFEPGYGHTIGNSLRRLLLSSLEGNAITAVKINNAPHEYSVLPGVAEDVMQIILNLKQVRFKSDSKDLQILKLHKKGRGAVVAGDIISNSNIEVINKELVIANLDINAELEMEIYVNRGRGYLSIEENDKSELPVNAIAIDAIFSPVIKVNYEVESARVGHLIDYDRLIIEIWTDGSIKPEDALAYSAKILKDSMNIFINFEEDKDLLVGYSSEKVEKKEVEQEHSAEKIKDLFEQSVEVIELSVRSANCLKSAKIYKIKELVSKKENELLSYKNFGRKSLDEIREKLQELGLNLGMDIKNI